MKEQFCHDCAVQEGEIHREGCDMERCPYCDRQLLSCPKHDWSNIKQEDREPYFFTGFSCVRCGKFFPEMIMVSDDMWKEICGKTYKSQDILCADCMNLIGVLREKLKEERNGKMLEM